MSMTFPGSSMVERLAVNQRVGSSNLSWGAITGCGLATKALVWGTRDRGFESHHPDRAVRLNGRAAEI